MYALTPALQAYDWGTTDVIAGLLGIAPTDHPVAEAWWGAHPDAPAVAATAQGPTPLTDLIAADAVGILGDTVAQRWGNALPYLLKVLSIDRPLSIQVHPSADQAQAGYDAERAADGDSTAVTYAFTDRWAKPELVVALTDMVVLAGFRPVGDLVRDLFLIEDPLAGDLRDALAMAHGDAAPVASAAAIARYVREVFALPCATPVLEAMTVAALAPDASRELRVAARAAYHHPGDPGALIALALNRVDLTPGQALFIDAGVVHSYQSGTALEVMANSDNVVRAGLTSKPVNIELFLALADTTVGPPPLVPPEVRGGARVFATATPEYELTLVSDDVIDVREGPRVVLALAGSAVVVSGEHSLMLSQGQAALVRHDDGPVVVTARDLVAIASVPSRGGR